jgi:hypothetical protein
MEPRWNEIFRYRQHRPCGLLVSPENSADAIGSFQCLLETDMMMRAMHTAQLLPLQSVSISRALQCDKELIHHMTVH